MYTVRDQKLERTDPVWGGGGGVMSLEEGYSGSSVALFDTKIGAYSAIDAIFLVGNDIGCV